jgi:hypothetical protein
MSEIIPPEEVVLPCAGSIPGIAGSLGPGRYRLDWTTRTARRIEPETPEARAPTSPDVASPLARATEDPGPDSPNTPEDPEDQGVSS